MPYYFVIYTQLKVHTVFPRNLATARFYFKALFDAATIQGQLDFEEGAYRDPHAHSFNNEPSVHVCTYNACVHT